MIRARLAAFVAAICLVAAACTGSTTTSTVGNSASAGGTAVPIPSVAPGGAPTLAQAVATLCVPATLPSGTPAAGTLPPALATIAHQVEVARGHDYVTPPAAEAISAQEMDRRLKESFAAYYPKDLYDRRTVAWRTIGVIPENADLHEAYRTFLTGEVIGFYDPETGELVYQGSENPSFIERLTLAHELTHALDDQIFNLKRLDHMTNTCQDEHAAAALGLVEGSAQYFSAATAAENPDISLPDLLQAIAESVAGGSAPAGVPPFVYAISTWPYSAGMSFVGTLAGTGGTAGVDRAFEQFPMSTEQVMHPDRYPSDAPTPVDIPDVTGALGEGWGDLDAMTIGEEWLRAMLALRLDGSEADAAAAGWDGGGYRAFTDGTDVVVVLRTAWDTPADAQAFATALTNWSTGSSVRPLIRQEGSGVSAVFATSAVSRRTAEIAVRSTF